VLPVASPVVVWLGGDSGVDCALAEQKQRVRVHIGQSKPRLDRRPIWIELDRVNTV